MRLSLLLCSAAIFPLSLNADTIEASSRVVAVTLYPWGASVVRRVEFDAPAGVHDLVVPDLPPDVPSDSLRVTGAAELTVGAVNLATGRLPAPETEPPQDVKAAEAEVERLEAVLRERDEAIAAIRLRIDAANEQWAFLRTFGQTKAGEAVMTGDVDSLRALTQLMGEEVLKARAAAHDAEVEAQAAERAKEDDIKALDEARRALSALVAEGQGRTVLSLAVESTGGPTSVEVTTFTDRAVWRPVYDLRLTRGEDPKLEIERSVLVTQASGEDWRGVALTLSTARPSGQSSPSGVYGNLLRIYKEGEEYDGFAQMEEPAPAPMAAPEPVYSSDARATAEDERAEFDVARPRFQGATVVYEYGAPVDIRDGVEDLRLRLDTVELEAEVVAVAVPSSDKTAFLVADMTNDTGQILLPGAAQLYLDGAFVGRADLPSIADGDHKDVGFGPIDGIRLTHTVMDHSAGSTGLIVSSNRMNAAFVLKVENLTGESWPMRVLDDSVPYSEQDDLEITWRATPQPTETDVDGERGVMAWEFELRAGKTQEIQIETNVSWPEGYELE